MDLRGYRERVQAWWSENAARVGADSAYYLLAASAFLPLLQVSPDLSAATGIVAGVGGNLLAEIVSRARQAVRDRGKQPTEDQLLQSVLHLSQRFENVRQALDELLARAGAVTMAQQDLRDQWQTFAARLLEEIPGRGGSPQIEQQVNIIVSGNVGAGAVIGSGTVHAENIVGRDYYDYRTIFMVGADPETALNHYLDLVLEVRCKLPLAAVYPEYDIAEVTLPAVYTMQDAVGGGGPLLHREVIGKAVESLSIGREGARETGRSFVEALHGFVETLGPEGRMDAARTPLVEIANAHRRLALIGGPGTGKTAFAAYLCLCMAGELERHKAINLAVLNRRLKTEDGEEKAAPRPDMWRHGALLPIFVQLRLFADSEGPYLPATIPAEASPSEYLVQFIVKTAQPRSFRRFLMEYLTERRGTAALVVLDGLDEVTSDRREPLRQVIEAFSERFPACRIILTSRPYAYTEDDVIGGFHKAEMAPLTAPQMAAFVRQWYAAAERAEPEKAANWAERLVRALDTRPILKEMGSRSPLMLTMAALVHRSERGDLPRGAAKLYEKMVTLLLKHWNQHRDEADLARDLHVHLDTLDKMLKWLAYEVQATGAPAVSGVLLHDGLTWARNLEGLPEEEGPYYDRIIHYLNRRAGILMAQGGWRLEEQWYEFPHGSFKEYLAAMALIQLPDKLALRLQAQDTDLDEEVFPDNLRALLWERPDRWREPARWAADYLALGDIPSLAWELVDCLCSDDPPDDDSLPGDAPAWLAALLIGEMLVMHQDALRRRKRDEKTVARVRLWLRRALEVGALPPPDRAAAGRALNLIGVGDDRPGVGLRHDGLPDIAWVDVPGGTVTLEDDAGTFEVEPFKIAKYPITYRQYRAFLDAPDGFHDDRWWEGLKRAEEPGEQAWSYDNHPRERVSWYDAMAFCRWLTARLRAAGDLEAGKEIRLPAEWEWQQAATGGDPANVYPWGPEYISGYANIDETFSKVGPHYLQATTAVGMYPQGATAQGALDMAGNVWEWCLNEYDNPKNTRSKHTSARAVRGGSWNLSEGNARCAARSRHSPDYRNYDQGFRVVCARPHLS